MDHLELIKEELKEEFFGDSHAINEEWDEGCFTEYRDKITEQSSPFLNFCLYRIFNMSRSLSHRFDYRTRHGGYSIFATDGTKIIRLTPKGKEYEQILKDEWNDLASLDPVELSEFILNSYNPYLHKCISDIQGLHNFSFCRAQRPGQYILNMAEYIKVKDCIGRTAISVMNNEVELRAITLKGGGHQKNDLGVETIYIDKEGTVKLRERYTLSTRIFSYIPRIH